MAHLSFALFRLPTELFDMVIEQMDYAAFINFAMATYLQLSRGDARFVPRLRREHVQMLRRADNAFLQRLPGSNTLIPAQLQIAAILPSQSSHRFWQHASGTIQRPNHQPPMQSAAQSQSNHPAFTRQRRSHTQLHHIPPEIYDMIFRFLSHKDTISLAIADWYWLCRNGIVQPIQFDRIWQGLILATLSTT
jgi:hypothetical protein